MKAKHIPPCTGLGYRCAPLPAAEAARGRDRPGGPSPDLLLRMVICGELSRQRMPQARSSLKLPRAHLSPYPGHLCRMIGAGLEKAAQDGPCGNPADRERAVGERDEIL